MADPFMGEIRMFAGTYAPRGWAFCNGQLLAIASNSALFSLLGTNYGGNGTTTFGLPDLRGRMAVGTGSGPGLTPVVLGEVTGTENVNVLSTNVPAVTAPVTTTASVAIPVNITAGTTKTPANTMVLSTTSDTAAGAEVDLYSAGPGTTTLQPFNVTATGQVSIPGGNQPLAIRNPLLGMNFIIALEGIYPSRN
ncbi:MAG TPA: tail fiber protein [Cellvibrio sp.]